MNWLDDLHDFFRNAYVDGCDSVSQFTPEQQQRCIKAWLLSIPHDLGDFDSIELPVTGEYLPETVGRQFESKYDHLRCLAAVGAGLKPAEDAEAALRDALWAHIGDDVQARFQKVTRRYGLHRQLREQLDSGWNKGEVA